jgi:hypothetical protein
MAMAHMSSACRICGQTTFDFGRQEVLGQFQAQYLRCGTCGYVFVDDPHWLELAYSNAIAALDTGIVTRNRWLADATCVLLGLSLRDVRSALDFGGGSGLLVRLMRDRGHDFRWLDAYSPNLLARGFEGDTNDRYDLVTAFELVEHLPDPGAVFARLHALAPTIIISTELLPPGRHRLDDWWYYAPESGQHIGFFTLAALEVVAQRLGLRLSSNGRNLHVLAAQPVSRALLRILAKPGRARCLAWTGTGKSLARRDAAWLRDTMERGQPREKGTSQER